MKFLKRFNKTIPILTYHSLNILENNYEGNDHIAFESDLSTIDKLGFKVVPLSKVIDWYEGIVPYRAIKSGVAITLDDGSWLDYYNVMHPTCGQQISMLNLLNEFRNNTPKSRQNTAHISSFVISSPEARSELEEKNLSGNGWWGDDWWIKACETGLMNIECHSWDHLHDLLDDVAQNDNLKGDFSEIKTFDDCSKQIVRAAEYIEQTTGVRPSFFAYPWGQASDYVTREFMPNHKGAHQFRAAFSIEPKHVSKKDNIWFLPRYVCGRDWKSPKELEDILLRR